MEKLTPLISQRLMDLNSLVQDAVERSVNQELILNDILLNIKALKRIQDLQYVDGNNLNYFMKDQQRKYSEAKQTYKYFESKLIKVAKERDRYKVEVEQNDNR